MKVLEVESDIFVDLFLSRNRNEAKQYQGLSHQPRQHVLHEQLSSDAVPFELSETHGVFHWWNHPGAVSRHAPERLLQASK